MGYYDSLPPSFGQQVFINEEGAALSNAEFGSSLDAVFQDPQFSVDDGSLNSVADALTGLGALAPPAQPAWTFITAPEDVSWSTANAANRVDIFGTNNPPVVAGSRGMRDLTLGNALVEGFVRRKQVEDKVAQLEALLNYSLNPSDGFVSVPVYQIWANKKPYGGTQGYFIIKDVRVKEAMRDLTGNATRAYVDISLMQVPAYQVNTGRDQASAVVAGTKSILPETPATGGTAGSSGSGSGSGSPVTQDANLPKGGPSAPSQKPATAPSSTGFRESVIFNPRTGAAPQIPIRTPPTPTP
jgi:hypothetical protein